MEIVNVNEKVSELSSKLLDAPDHIALEKLLLEKIFPFLSSNALILGLFALYELEVVPYYFLLAPTLIVMLAMVAWKVYHDTEGPLNNILTGTFMVLASLVLYMTTTGALYFILTYALSVLFALAIQKRYINESSLWYYMFYVPILWGMIFSESVLTRLLITFPLVLIMFGLFYRWKFKRAATASITAAVFAGVVELIRNSNYNIVFIILLGAALVGAIFYERKIIESEVSDIKMFLRQGILVGIMMILLFAIHSTSEFKTPVVWSWFFWIGGYQVVMIFRKSGNVSTRYGWIMITMLFCFFEITEKDTGLIISLLYTLVGLGSALFAIHRQSRFLLNIALCFLLLSQYLQLVQSEDRNSPLIILAALLTWASLVWLTGTVHVRNRGDNHWWTGFIRKEDLETLKHYSELVVDKIYKIPVVGGIFSLVTSFLTMLKNIKGEGNPLSYLDFLFILSQFLVIEVITNQLNLLSIFRELPPWQQDSLKIIVYLFFGSLLFISGAYSSNLFFRLLGIVVFMYPLAMNTINDEIFQASAGYLYGITGLLIGFIYTWYVSGKRVTDEKLGSEDA